MKTKLHLILFALLMTLSAIAQPPQKFKYQGVVRRANGSPFTNQNVSVRITVHEDDTTGTAVYVETHNTTTNQFGLFNIDVGSVNPGSFDTIKWGQHKFYQETEIDTSGGTNFIPMGTTQYNSVPYALTAQNVMNNAFQGMFVYDNPSLMYWFTALADQNVMVEVWGGGGGGGFLLDLNNFVIGGSGGGAGGYAKGIFHLNKGDVISITVGEGGLGAGSLGGDGVNGGASSFGSLLYANGGNGGEVIFSNYSASGGSSFGQYSLPGGDGGGYEASYIDYLFIGGDSPNGGSGGVYGPNGIQDGKEPGGGGACYLDNYGYGFTRGGNGAKGRVVIYY